MVKGTKYLSIVVLLALAGIFIGCQTGLTTAMNNAPVVDTPAVDNSAATADAATTPANDAPRISLADAKAAFDAGTAIYVDSRAESAYKQEHIKGAINIPGGTLDSKIKQLSKDKKIIVYCS